MMGRDGESNVLLPEEAGVVYLLEFFRVPLERAVLKFFLFPAARQSGVLRFQGSSSRIDQMGRGKVFGLVEAM